MRTLQSLTKTQGVHELSYNIRLLMFTNGVYDLDPFFPMKVPDRDTGCDVSQRFTYVVPRLTRRVQAMRTQLCIVNLAK